MIVARPSPDRIERLEQLLRTFTATYGPDSSLARQVARNLTAARAARDEQDDRAPNSRQPEAA